MDQANKLDLTDSGSSDEQVELDMDRGFPTFNWSDEEIVSSNTFGLAFSTSSQNDINPTIVEEASDHISNINLDDMDLNRTFAANSAEALALLAEAATRQFIRENPHLASGLNQGYKLVKTDLQKSVLQKSNLQKSNLQKSNLQKSNLQKSDLQKSYQQRSDQQKCDQQKCDQQQSYQQQSYQQQSDQQQSYQQQSDQQQSYQQQSDQQKSDNQQSYQQQSDQQQSYKQQSDQQQSYQQQSDQQQSYKQQSDQQQSYKQQSDQQKSDQQQSYQQQSDQQLSYHQQTVLQPTDLQQLDQYETDSQQLDQHETDSQQLDQHETYLQQIDHQETVLQQIDHQETVLQQIDHQEIVLQHLDIYETELQQIDQQEGVLQHIDHQETNLQQTDLQQNSLKKSGTGTGTGTGTGSSTRQVGAKKEEAAANINLLQNKTLVGLQSDASISGIAQGMVTSGVFEEQIHSKSSKTLRSLEPRRRIKDFVTFRLAVMKFSSSVGSPILSHVTDAEGLQQVTRLNTTIPLLKIPDFIQESLHIAKCKSFAGVLLKRSPSLPDGGPKVLQTNSAVGNEQTDETSPLSKIVTKRSGKTKVAVTKKLPVLRELKPLAPDNRCNIVLDDEKPTCSKYCEVVKPRRISEVENLRLTWAHIKKNTSQLNIVLDDERPSGSKDFKGAKRSRFAQPPFPDEETQYGYDGRGRLREPWPDTRHLRPGLRFQCKKPNYYEGDSSDDD